MKPTYNQREAITAITNIRNAVLHLETFFGKAREACRVIQFVLDDLQDGGLDERDQFIATLLDNLRTHLLETHDGLADRLTETE